MKLIQNPCPADSQEHALAPVGIDDRLTSEAPHCTTIPLSIIILTRNEECNIQACLSALDWADDVIVVDSFSTDDTLAAARHTRQDVRVFQNEFLDFGAQRNWALDETDPRHDWILFLDADEICNSECAEAIERTILNPGEFVGFYLTCRNFFLGKWIKHCTLYPSWQLRLLKRGEVRYRKEGHGQREVTDGPLGFISQPYDHYGFSHGIEHWIARHNAYSTNEVELILRMRREPLTLQDLFFGKAVEKRRCLKRLAARVPGRPILRFLYLYFWRLGFLDGRAGWIFTMLRVGQEIHITAKLEEGRSLSDRTCDSGTTETPFHSRLSSHVKPR